MLPPLCMGVWVVLYTELLIFFSDTNRVESYLTHISTHSKLSLSSTCIAWISEQLVCEKGKSFFGTERCNLTPVHGSMFVDKRTWQEKTTVMAIWCQHKVFLILVSSAWRSISDDLSEKNSTRVLNCYISSPFLCVTKVGKSCGGSLESHHIHDEKVKLSSHRSNRNDFKVLFVFFFLGEDVDRRCLSLINIFILRASSCTCGYPSVELLNKINRERRGEWWGLTGQTKGRQKLPKEWMPDLVFETVGGLGQFGVSLTRVGYGSHHLTCIYSSRLYAWVVEERVGASQVELPGCLSPGASCNHSLLPNPRNKCKGTKRRSVRALSLFWTLVGVGHQKRRVTSRFMRGPTIL